MKYLLPLVLVCLPVTLSAQTPTVPTQQLSWDQPAPSLATAQSYVYEIQVDTDPPIVASHTCTGAASPFICSAPLPAMTPGPHELRARASETINGSTLTSDYSTPLSILMRAVPAVPINLRVTE